jgi:Domain of unknown function (DUF4282)
MPDRPSSQSLPDDWDRGGHAARGQYPGAAPSDGYDAGPAASFRARTADAYGTEATDAYDAGKAEFYGARAAAPYGVGNASFGTRNADPFADRGADPFADRGADPFGDRKAGSFGADTTAAYGAGAPDAARVRVDPRPPTVEIQRPAPGEASGARGFLSALFDWGFTSFVAPKVIRAVYVLIFIGTVITALVFTILMFRVSAAFGLLTLVIGDPLFVLIVMAIYRIILEYFVVTFRVAEDIRALRERGDLK